MHSFRLAVENVTDLKGKVKKKKSSEKELVRDTSVKDVSVRAAGPAVFVVVGGQFLPRMRDGGGVHEQRPQHPAVAVGQRGCRLPQSLHFFVGGELHGGLLLWEIRCMYHFQLQKECHERELHPLQLSTSEEVQVLVVPFD
ncbi:hypothetical protein CDAR_203851 [Caerostris darwini]|uniref:Uncharacterized protein n=1 Tax=Caerostris darwini TaxID=1538125 RepID=A0AAV4PDI3_9ARAC|nr:hypothetical protein CDAR_203851 [Caerostris darwini]